jgi:penicillin-binding protein 1A
MWLLPKMIGFGIFILDKLGYLLGLFILLPPAASLRKRVLWRIMNILVVFFILLFLVDNNFLWLFGKSPRIATINSPDMKITSELYSADGKIMAKYYDENRQPMKFEEIPPDFIKALVATEDSRFYSHFGIDLKATIGIFYYMAKGEKRGGSTITQQLVKNLFKTRSNFSRGLLGSIPGVSIVIYKLKEWIAALKIEFLYSKDEILTMYCNTVDFGSNSFGLKTAARTYFACLPADMSPGQTALLVGMLKAPSYYHPVSKPENALERRNVVLGQMMKAGLLSNIECDSLSKLPLALTYKPVNSNDDEGSYIRDAVSSYLRAWLKDNDYDLYADGLKIYCSIDSKLQNYAEEAVSEHMKRLQKRFFQHWEGQVPWSDKEGNELPGYIHNIVKNTKFYTRLQKRFNGNQDSVDYYLNRPHQMNIFSWKGEIDTSMSFLDSVRYYNYFLHAGFMAMDQSSGEVKAWVGGINHKHFKYDHVKQSKRQPGSTFKAFVYTAAFDTLYGPCDHFSDIPVTYNYVENGQKMSWSPKNADANFTGHEVSLKYAFAKSINSIAVQVTQKIGWKKVIDYAYKMGIKTPLNDVPSVCLGSSDVSLFELVDAYCPLVNQGYAVEPIFITRIEDKNGHVIFNATPKQNRVLSEETAFYMNQMLVAGLTEPGATTQALFDYDLFRYNTDFGGKTGTSSNHSDGWFVGVSPHLIAGAWVGGESRLIHFKTSELGEGCKTALPIFGLFFEKVLKDKNYENLKGRFPKPSVKLTKSYTCHTILPKSDSIKQDSISVSE